MENLWSSYLNVKARCLYKNKYLRGRGLSSSQIVELMRKFKVYIDRIDKSPMGSKIRDAETTEEVVCIIKSLFDNEWDGYIKETYKDIPSYFLDYARFIRLLRDFSENFLSEGEKQDFFWPDGSKMQISDFSEWTKAKHNHIRLTIDGKMETYSGINALLKVCQYIGYSDIAQFNLTTNGLKLLVKHVPLGKEKKYMEAGDGWNICTSCETKTKLRLIKIIASHFHKNINAEFI